MPIIGLVISFAILISMLMVHFGATFVTALLFTLAFIGISVVADFASALLFGVIGYA